MAVPEVVNWGILGPGRIAGRFAAGLRDAAGARLVAVGSRSAERAAQFAAEQRTAGSGAPRAHAGYEALAADPDVHAIYVATPHPQHAAACRLCLEAGKHVLCEKPLTVNAEQARAVAACARAYGVLLMEGMWTRFMPATAALRALLEAGEIGEPHVVHADMGFAATPDPASRLFAPDWPAARCSTWACTAWRSRRWCSVRRTASRPAPTSAPPASTSAPPYR